MAVLSTFARSLNHLGSCQNGASDSVIGLGAESLHFQQAPRYKVLLVWGPYCECQGFMTNKYRVNRNNLVYKIWETLK